MGPDIKSVLAEAQRILTPEAVEAIEGVNGDRVVLSEAAERSGTVTSFPGWPHDVLPFAIENQGVCSWGLSLGGDPLAAVVVGGDLHLGVGTLIYCADLQQFVDAWLWDAELFGRGSLLQAQASPLDDASLALLRDRYTEKVRTEGWPCTTSLRFEGDDLQILLWCCEGQTDWWIAGDTDQIAAALPTLLVCGDLPSSLWSNDPAGMQFLEQNISPLS